LDSKGVFTVRHFGTLLLLSALLAALAQQVESASATSFKINARPFRFVLPSLTFTTPEGFASVRCPVTLEGSLHSGVIAKVARSLIGHITNQSFGSCTGGTVRTYGESLPWHVQYDSFSTALPNIRSVTMRVVGMMVLVTPTGLGSCSYRTDNASPARFRMSLYGGEVIGLTAVESATIPSATFFCPSGVLRGSGQATRRDGGPLVVGLAGGTLGSIRAQEDPSRMIRGQRQVTITLYNVATAPAHELYVKPGRFELGESRLFNLYADGCAEALLLPSETGCPIIIEYIGEEGVRPKTIDWVVDYYNGSTELETKRIGITAE